MKRTALFYFTNSVDPDPTSRVAASDLGLHLLPMSHLWVTRHKRVNECVFEQVLQPLCPLTMPRECCVLSSRPFQDIFISISALDYLFKDTIFP